MGITHIKDFDTIVEAIPPTYSKYIMEQYLKTKAEKGDVK